MEAVPRKADGRRIFTAAFKREQVAAVLKYPQAVLAGRIEGTNADGGPACATVSLLDGGWYILTDPGP